MKVKVGQDYVYKGETKKYVHIINSTEKEVKFKDYKSYKDKLLINTRRTTCRKDLFLEWYLPINMKVRRLS